jgi:PhnB protein
MFKSLANKKRPIPKAYPGVIPMLAYENGVAALEWLVQAFGFTERHRALGPDGRLSHGEVDTGDGVIMLATPTPDYESPRHHRENCERARKWSTVPRIVEGVLVYVDDVTKHHERAQRAGATIITAPEDGSPSSRYRAEDLEGHRWMFLERAKR